MELRRLTLHDVHEAAQAHEELAHEGFEFLHGYEPDMDWADFLDRKERFLHGIDLSENHVAETFLVAVAGGELVGRVSIRHHLNPALRLVGVILDTRYAHNSGGTVLQGRSWTLH